MGREIKFRAKCFGNWRYGSYVHFDKKPINSRCNINYKDFIVTNEDDGEGYYPITDLSYIGQYSGLRDKDREEIYDGDIIEYYELGTYCINPDCDVHLLGYGSSINKKEGVVKFENGVFGVDDESDYPIIPLTDCGIYEDMLDEMKEDTYLKTNGYNIDNSIVGIKVIGNIHDNPELIK